jgi:hypothetical protein
MPPGFPNPKLCEFNNAISPARIKLKSHKAEGCDRETVSRIVRSSEMAEYIERMKEEFRGLVPDALAALRHTLQTQKDGRIALEILRDVGVAPRKGEPPQLPATTPEDGYSRQAIMIANVLLEAQDNLGVDLPENVAAALAKDAQERAEAGATLGAKLSRR